MMVTNFISSSEEHEPVVISWPSNIFLLKYDVLKLLVASLFNHTPVRGERMTPPRPPNTEKSQILLEIVILKSPNFYREPPIPCRTPQNA